MSTRFSIITVCYNARETLPGAVASLVAQTYPLREWVVLTVVQRRHAGLCADSRRAPGPFRQ